MSAGLFGQTLDEGTEPRAPAWLVAKIVRRAASIRGCCLPDLCLEHSGGVHLTPDSMSPDDARALYETLGLMVAIELRNPGAAQRAAIKEAEGRSAAEPARSRRNGHGRPRRSG